MVYFPSSFDFYRNISNCFTLEYELLVQVNILIMFRKYIGEGNGTPLQYSCLENPMDGRSLVGCSPWGRTELDTTEAS